ncbi:MAG: hypothetical protein CMP41_03140 [Rickettsiales bacterium]|nr:hypothetical protein [Rickettsiales bacterium]
MLDPLLLYSAYLKPQYRQLLAMNNAIAQCEGLKELKSIAAEPLISRRGRSADEKKLPVAASSFYDKDYFLNGKESGKSLYENYRWLPTETTAMAKAICSHLGSHQDERILDYGCARGYLVKALRALGLKAYGCDVSTFAVSNCDPEVSDYITLVDETLKLSALPREFQDYYDFIICKDVLEHIPQSEVGTLIRSLRKLSNSLYVVVPLGDDGAYRIEDYSLDQSHVIAEDENWWAELFDDCGFSNIDFSFSVKGVKEAASLIHPYGNGHFRLSY